MMYYYVLPKIPPAVPAIVLNQWTKTPYAGFLSGLIRYKSLQIYQHNTNWSHHPTPWNVLKKVSQAQGEAASPVLVLLDGMGGASLRAGGLSQS